MVRDNNRRMPVPPSKKEDVRHFIDRRVILLRHGCLCSDARVIWTFREIAEALAIT